MPGTQRQLYLGGIPAEPRVEEHGRYPRIDSLPMRVLWTTDGRACQRRGDLLEHVPFGPAKTTEHVPAIARRETARRHLMRGENEPAFPSPKQRV